MNKKDDKLEELLDYITEAKKSKLDWYIKLNSNFNNLIKLNKNQILCKSFYDDQTETKICNFLLEELKESLSKPEKQDNYNIEIQKYYINRLGKIDDPKCLPDVLYYPNKIILDEISEKYDYDLTYEEIRKIMWPIHGIKNDWRYIDSNIFELKEEKKDIEHRLYINSHPKDTRKIVLDFIKTCKEKEIPYLLKYDPLSTRDDGIVIFSSDKYLNEYIKIINNVIKKDPIIKERIMEPSIYTSKINEYISYSKNIPFKEIEEEKSYPEMEHEIIKEIMEKELKEWLEIYIDEKVIPTKENIRITPREYMEETVVKKTKIELFKELIATRTELGRRKAKKYLGYDLKFLISKETDIIIKELIKKPLSNYLNDNHNQQWLYINDKKMILLNRIFKETKKLMLYESLKVDPSLKELIELSEKESLNEICIYKELKTNDEINNNIIYKKIK